MQKLTEELDTCITAMASILNKVESREEVQRLFEYVRSKLDEKIKSKKQIPRQVDIKKYPIQLLTWNLQGLTRTKQTSIEAVIDLIQQLQMNIVCFQEIKESAALDIIKYQLNKDFKKGEEQWEYESSITGNAFQFKEIAACFYNKKHFKLIACQYGLKDNTFCRKPQILTFQKGNTIFTVSNLHLKDGSRDFPSLEKELFALESLSNNLKIHFKPSFNILAGDFNYNLSNPLKVDTSYFTNCSPASVVCTPSKPTMSKNDNIYDYFVVAPFTNTVSYEEIQIDKSRAQLMNKQYISDHLPIAFQLQIKKL